MHFAFILCAGLWWGNLKEGDNLEDLSIDVGAILRFILNKYGMACTGFFWPRIRTSVAF